MKNTRVARRYAQALMMTTDSAKGIDAIAGDLEKIKEIFDGSRELRRFIDSPVVSVQKKSNILRALFGPRVGITTMTFIELLTEKQREGLLLDIIEQYFALRDAKYGIINIDVASAVEVTLQQKKSLSENLERSTRKKVHVRFALDKALQGGLVVKIGDTVHDASIKRQLELMRKQFVEGHELN